MDLHLQAAKLDKQWLRQTAADLLPSPLTLDVIARMAAVGITHDAWRCGPVEDWHSTGRITDGQMMRFTSLTSWEVEGHIDEWCADLGLEPDASPDDLDSHWQPKCHQTMWRTVAGRKSGWKIIIKGRRLQRCRYTLQRS